MEILIIGVIVVALMAYASTRIKKSAAAAFESETVETAEFIIQKPEGFLNIVDPSPPYMFEAYSKEFGEGSASKFKMGRAFLTTVNGEGGIQVPADLRVEVIDDVHYRIFEIERMETEVQFVEQFKIADKDGRHFEFRTTRISNAPQEFINKLEGMLDSFRLK
ncbi:MAG: hypothetical protein JO053_10620 [Acidobacteria bacterium]|nr:hypothetical protein [Acidobacteriota bacterium]